MVIKLSFAGSARRQCQPPTIVISNNFVCQAPYPGGDGIDNDKPLSNGKHNKRVIVAGPARLPLDPASCAQLDQLLLIALSFAANNLHEFLGTKYPPPEALRTAFLFGQMADSIVCKFRHVP